MEIVKYINAPLAFLLELIMLYLYGNWAFQFGKNIGMKWVLASLCVIIVSVLWGIFAAPKSNTRLQYPWLLIFESIILITPAVVMYLKNPSKYLVIYTVLVVISQILGYIFRFKD